MSITIGQIAQVLRHDLQVIERIRGRYVERWRTGELSEDAFLHRKFRDIYEFTLRGAIILLMQELRIVEPWMAGVDITDYAPSKLIEMLEDDRFAAAFDLLFQSHDSPSDIQSLVDCIGKSKQEYGLVLIRLENP